MEQVKELKIGTTTVGIVYKGGVVLAAEKKSTLGYLVASKEEVKIVEIVPHIGMTHAGVAGDLQALTRFIKAEARLFELRNKKRVSLKATTTLLSNILYGRRMSFFPFMVQIIVGGYDDNGPGLFILHPDGSTIEEKKFFATGSGSPMAFGVFEALYKKDMSINDTKSLAVKAIKSAVERDIASGGRGIDVAIVDENGFKMVDKEEVERILEKLKK